MKKNKITELYEAKQKEWKDKIHSKPTKWLRFWSWVWYLIAFPWVWLFYNIRDWRSAVIFVIVFIVLSSEVWLPYLIGLIFWGNEGLRITMFSIGSVCWLFWLGPGTPFIVICISVTIGVKALFNKIKSKNYGKRTN